jgi:hypothetical protein
MERILDEALNEGGGSSARRWAIVVLAFLLGMAVALRLSQILRRSAERAVVTVEEPTVVVVAADVPPPASRRIERYVTRARLYLPSRRGGDGDGGLQDRDDADDHSQADGRDVVE